MKNNQEIKKKLAELQEYFLNKILNNQVTDVKMQKYELDNIYLITFEVDNEYTFIFLYQDKLNHLSQQISTIMFKLSQEHVLQLIKIVKQNITKYTMLNLNKKQNDKPNT